MTDQYPPAESQPPEVVVARPVVGGTVATPPHRPLELNMLSRRAAGLDLALLVLVLLLVPVGFDLFSVLLYPQQAADLPTEGAAPLYVLLIGRKWFDVLLVVGLVAYFVYRHHLPGDSFGLRGGVGRQVLAAVPALVALYAVYIVTVAAVWAMISLLPGLEEDVARRKEFLDLMPLDSFTGMLLLLIPVAIHEELLFRALLIPYLRRIGLGWWGALLVSSIVFALLHGAQGWLGMIQVFFLGLVFGACFLLSRSVLTVAIAHFVFDLLQLLLARELLPWLESLTPET